MKDLLMLVFKTSCICKNQDSNNLTKNEHVSIDFKSELMTNEAWTECTAAAQNSDAVQKATVKLRDIYSNSAVTGKEGIFDNKECLHDFILKKCNYSGQFTLAI
jgi:hypothetical protein